MVGVETTLTKESVHSARQKGACRTGGAHPLQIAPRRGVRGMKLM